MEVGGGVLAFYDPETNGFREDHLSVMDSPVVDLESLGIDPGPLELRFWANSDPAPSTLKLVAGYRSLTDGKWSAWVDSRTAIFEGLQEYCVPIASGASIFQVRIGVANDSSAALAPASEGKGPAVDKVRIALKADDGVQWRYVPAIAQVGPNCEPASYTSALAYWAYDGPYAHLLEPDAEPGDNENVRKTKAFALYNALKTLMKPPQEVPGGKRLGRFGVDAYIKARAQHADKPPAGAPGLERIEWWNTFLGDEVTWEKLKEAHQAGVVVIGLTWRLGDGSDATGAGHAVVVAGVNDGPPGTKRLWIMNPWVPSDILVVTRDNRSKAYQEMMVSVQQDGTMRLDNTDIEKKYRAEYLSVEYMAVVRERPPECVGLSTAGGVVADSGAHGAYGGARASLRTFSYVLQNGLSEPLNYYALVLDVPYYNVGTPSGWDWQPLPAQSPAADTCEVFGVNGILWSTTTDPIRPGEVGGAFAFDTDMVYGADSAAVLGVVAANGILATGRLFWGPSSDATGVEGEYVEGALRRVGVFPNPGRAPFNIEFSHRDGAEVDVLVVDPAGRTVSRPFAGRAMGPAKSLLWDGRDDSGRLVPSGRYFVRLVVDGTELSGSLLVLIR
jgi:hypothetical protein